MVTLCNLECSRALVSIVIDKLGGIPGDLCIFEVRDNGWLG
jgi:hypothetical protein